MARTLILLRHAKSMYPPGVPDAERPLAPRGERDAPAAGRWIAQRYPAPGALVLSPARRTRETWGLASAEAPGWPDPILEDRVYEADAGTLLGIARDLPRDVTEAILIGHNPGLEDLALLLAGDADPQVLGRLMAKFPTSGVAVIDIAGDWADLPRGARLSEMAVPRG